MRLLFDEQLAEALCALLQDVFPDSLHVRLIGLGGGSDDRVWQAARERGCLLALRGAPPKVVWIRIGNCGTAEIAAVLRRHSDDIRRLAERDDDAVLELGRA